MKVDYFISIKIDGEDWTYDYVSDKLRLTSEMTKEEITKSERAKWKLIGKI